MRGDGTRSQPGAHDRQHHDLEDSPSAASALVRDGRGKHPPRDNYSLVYIVFFLQGVGMLFPWNVFISAPSYFTLRLADTNFKDNFENIFSFTYSFSNLLMMVISVRHAHRTFFTMRFTVAWPQIMTALIFSAVCAMVEINLNGNLLFGTHVAFVLVCGITAALLQAGIFGLAGRFPPMYTQAVMSGQGVAGATVSIISLVTAADAPCDGGQDLDSVRSEYFAYFLSSTIIIVITLIAFLTLTGSDFAQYYAFSLGDVNGNGSSDILEDGPAADADLAERIMGLNDFSPRTQERMKRESILNSPVLQRSTPGSTPGNCTPRDDSPESFAGARTTVAPGGTTERQLLLKPEPEADLSSTEIFFLIGRHCISVCLVFLATLSVFPGLTSEIRSSTNMDNVNCPESGRFFGGRVWQGLFFLIFNVGDTLGRMLAACKQIVAPRYIIYLSIARFAFIPLFLFCNVVPSSSGHQSNHNTTSGWVDGSTYKLGLLSNDAWPLLFMTLLAVSNGYLASLEMMNAPEMVPANQQSKAGTIMAFFLVLGLVLGSLCSFIVRAIACGCNPFTSSG